MKATGDDTSRWIRNFVWAVGNHKVLDHNWGYGVQRDISGNSEREKFLQLVRSRGVSGEFTCKVGGRISDILLNGVDTLSLMLEDGLLEKFYRHSAPIIHNNERAALLVSNLAHENPNLRVLEIGAGTGGVTLSVLERLGGASGQVPRFQDYVFTDISSGFFENAQGKLKAWSNLVTYRRLNVEEDPVSQNFEPEAFDLIIAAKVLRATTRMTRTLQNVRRLLKPGGKLLLVEITTIRAQLFPFGTIPGWWAGEFQSKVGARQESLVSFKRTDKAAGEESLLCGWRPMDRSGRLDRVIYP